ncbi:hypothetical protein HJC99_04425 [Candidatus Saccharibacteria bacterium]|nr:hypothetical protein [Candidatus Saccharibacteria bacterium]
MSDHTDDNLGPQYAADLHRQGEVETAVKPAHKRRRWLGRLTGLVFVGMVVGLAVIGMLKFANDPVSGTTVSAKSLKQSTDPTPAPPGTLHGLYASMNYPGVFNQVSQVKTDANALEQYNLGSSTTYRRTITVDISSFPTGKPHDDSNYRLREIQSATYMPSTKTVNGETVYIMTKNDASEVSWFWPHAGKLLVVAVTTTQPGDHPADFATLVMNSVRWNS